MEEVMSWFYGKVKSYAFLGFLGLFLFIMLLLSSYSLVVQQSVSEEFVMETFQEINFYRRIDKHYLENYLSEEPNNGDLSNYEELPVGQRTVGYLFDQVNRTKVLQENSEQLVPEIIDYLTGESEQLTLMMSLEILEDELNKQLSDLDSFKEILQLEMPEQARIFDSLPEDFQYHFHHVIKKELISEIQIPEELPLSYLMDEDMILTPLTNIRSSTVLFNNAFNATTILAILSAITLVAIGKIRGLLVTGIAMFFAGGIVLLSPALMTFDFILLQLTEVYSHSRILNDIMYQAFTQIQNLGLWYTISGAILLIVGVISRYYFKRA